MTKIPNDTVLRIYSENSETHDCICKGLLTLHKWENKLSQLKSQQVNRHLTTGGNTCRLDAKHCMSTWNCKFKQWWAPIIYQLEWLKLKTLTTVTCCREWWRAIQHSILVGNAKVMQPLCRKAWQVLTQIIIFSSHSSATFYYCHCLIVIKINWKYTHIKSYIQMFMEVLVLIAKIW